MSTPFRLHIPRQLYEEMVAQAVSELPNECCGLLAGGKEQRAESGEHRASDLGLAVRCYPLVNAAGSPVEYVSDPESMFAAVRDMRRLGIDILAVYHSHPTSAPVPSRTDLERNYSPGGMNLIISLKDGKPLVRGGWLTEDEYRGAAGETVQ